MSVSIKEDADRASKFSAVLKTDRSSAGGATKSPRPQFRFRRLISVSVVCLLLVSLVAAGMRTTLFGSGKVTGNVLTEKVRRSDLIVSITEDGNVESAHNVDIKCEVQGGATILWLIPDGTFVNKGDELARMDSSLIEEKIDQQKIVVERAKALKIEAEKTFEAAKIAVQEYIEGTYIQSLQDLKAKATVAKENLETARNLLQFTNKMARQGYVTPLQRDAQAFAVQRATLDLQVAQTAIDVLEKFTKAKTLVGLESARDSAGARQASEQAAYDLEDDRLKKLVHQLEKCVITAPDEGMVVYANEALQQRRGSSQMSPVEEGAIMRERQNIIKLPDLTKMQVKCTVHESKVDHLQRGMRARIRIQDHEYQGIVNAISNQPEPSDWFSGNVKQYAAIVSIESDPAGLRPGMTAAVEILVSNLKNVLSVPVQAVVEKRNKYYCWVDGTLGPDKRPVVLGMSDNARIEIKDGLKEGDDVLLNPRATVEEAREEEKSDEKVDVTKKFGGDGPAALANAQAGRGGKGKQGAGGAGKGPPTLDMKTLDKNGDGKLAKEEMPERMQDYFDNMDSDHDGFISAKELAEIRNKMKQMQQQGGPGGPGGEGGPAGGR